MESHQSAKIRKWGRIFIFVILVVPALLFSAWTWMTLHFVYASGDRAGYVQKISKKGWICKTWEGELAMVNLPGAMPQIFQFSVRNDAVAQEISRTIGQRVSIHYEQHKGIPGNCFGDTEYFITSIQHVADAR